MGLDGLRGTPTPKNMANHLSPTAPLPTLRPDLLARLGANTAYDVAIVGGGATGLGVALDAASRGLRVVLVEAQDFAKGTSSRSTKLVHGGVRYLADLLRLFGNDTGLALAAYNAGENAVWRHGGKIPPYPETVAYVPRVLDFYRRLKSASLPTDPNFLPL